MQKASFFYYRGHQKGVITHGLVVLCEWLSGKGLKMKKKETREWFEYFCNSTKTNLLFRLSFWASFSVHQVTFLFFLHKTYFVFFFILRSPYWHSFSVLVGVFFIIIIFLSICDKDIRLSVFFFHTFNRQFPLSTT